MKGFIYGVVTFFVGGAVHLLFNRYMTVGEAGPEILLLFVVAHGFLVGPLAAETLGFFWGLAVDSMGVGLFGLQSFLFAVAGFTAGALRRRVASARPAAQLAIGFTATVYYLAGSYFMRVLAGGAQYGWSPLAVIISVILNVFLVVIVFFLLERWIDYWRLESEEI